MVEHCSANAEATGSNPVEAPKSLFFFFGLILHKSGYNCDDHIFISFQTKLSTLATTDHLRFFLSDSQLYMLTPRNLVTMGALPNLKRKSPGNEVERFVDFSLVQNWPALYHEVKLAITDKNRQLQLTSVIFIFSFI